MHNILQLTLNNDEQIGSAGTVLLERIYTYNSDNYVITEGILPRTFDDDSSTFKYAYECETANLITDQRNVQVQIYPNPAKGQIQLNTSEEIEEVKVINQLGEVVYFEKQPTGMINLKDKAEGLYLINIKLKGSKKPVIQKLVLIK